MIFYTLQGPEYKMEIDKDKIKLTRKVWGLVSFKTKTIEYNLADLAQFEVTSPKSIWGTLECSTFDGRRCAFKFSTRQELMEKIEKYMQKVIAKNMERLVNHGESSKGQESSAAFGEASMAA